MDGGFSLPLYKLEPDDKSFLKDFGPSHHIAASGPPPIFRLAPTDRLDKKATTYRLQYRRTMIEHNIKNIIIAINPNIEKI